MKRNILYIICCMIALSACSILKKSNSSAQNENAITDQKWKLIELEGKPVAEKINGKVPFILFQKEDSRYTGTAGCNGLNGTFTLADHNRIKFSQGISTMMACEDMTAETGLNKVLQTADNYTINGNVLSLNKARMAPLARFERIK